MSTRPLHALILAGGLSRRMGRDKATVLLGQKTMIARVAERLSPQVASLAVNAIQPPDPELSLPLVPDTIAGHAGPLAGILAGLKRTRTEYPAASHLLTVPADTPFLPADLADRLHAALGGTEEIALAASAGRSHPVVALWPLSIAADLEAWLADPANRRLQSFIARHAATVVDFPPIETAAGPLDPFFNVNTPDDLVAAERFLEALEA